MKWFDNTALTIVIIGAVNWLLVGIFRFDLVASAHSCCSDTDRKESADRLFRPPTLIFSSILHSLF